MNKQEKNNIIYKLTKQHNDLKKELAGVMNIRGYDKANFAEIASGLVKFSNDLINHIEDENKYFYKELLREMKEAKQSTAETEEFINEMTSIGKVIFSFIERYDSAQKLEKDFASYKKEIAEINEVLILRVESEEAGVFVYWN